MLPYELGIVTVGKYSLIRFTEGNVIAESLANRLKTREPDQMPLIVGHRGARGEMPENTLTGLDHAYATGVRTIEIDVQTAADGVPVVWHDPVLMPDKVRASNGQWVAAPGLHVAERTTTELSTYRVGYLKEDSPTRLHLPDQASCDKARISTLSAVCDWVSDHANVYLNVEIKSFHHVVGMGDLPDALARSVLSVLEAHALLDRVLVTSFDWRVLEHVHCLAPAVQTGCLSHLPAVPEDDEQNIYAGSVWMNGANMPSADLRLPQIVKEQGVSVWVPHFRDLLEADITLAHDLELFVIVWTVNERADVAAMTDMGVDGIITDYPTRVRAWLDSMGGATSAESAEAEGVR